MVIESTADIEEIRSVQDSQGNDASPANQAQQERIAEPLENEDGLTAFEYATSGTTAEQLPSNAVPEGVAVAVAYQSGNSDIVYVGGSAAQTIPMSTIGSAISLCVSNTDQIYVQTLTAGDSVGVLFEGGQ
jgi:hypothetical protein